MITASVNRIIYNGNGQTTEFPYSFAIINADDVKVMTIDPDNKETVLDSDYYVDTQAKKVIYPGYPPGQDAGESEKPPILPAGWKLVVYREVPITQESKLSDVWPFNVIEAGLDKLTMICQVIKDDISRCFIVGPATPLDVDTTIPWEAGKGFRISDDGKRIEVTEDPAKVTPQVEALLSQTKQQANIATQQATAAAESALSAADSEVNAETAMTQARASAALSQKWADSAESPDGQEDADSPTGETMSAKEWALYAKDLIQQIDPDKIVTGVTETDGTVKVETGDGNSNSFEVLTPSMKNAVNGVAGLDDKSKLLSQVYDFATQEEVQAGTDNKKPVNSAGVKQAIDAILTDEVDYVIETYQEGSNWYRLYKSGWVVQGGKQENQKEVTLLKPMKDTNYDIKVGVQTNSSATGYDVIADGTITTTGFQFRLVTTNITQQWRVEGYAE